MRRFLLLIRLWICIKIYDLIFTKKARRFSLKIGPLVIYRRSKKMGTVKTVAITALIAIIAVGLSMKFLPDSVKEPIGLNS